MAEQQSSKKKNKGSSETNKIIEQWGIPLGILLVVITVLVSNFSKVSNNAAKENVNASMESKVQSISDKYKAELDIVANVGVVVEDWIDMDKMQNPDYLRKHANAMRDNLDSVFMVAITDLDGVGICSEDEGEIDLSSEDYFKDVEECSFYREDSEQITGKRCTVVVVPIEDNVAGRIGYIYLYVDSRVMGQKVELDSYSGDVANAIIDVEGNVLVSWGDDSVLTSANNIFADIKNVTVVDSQDAMIKRRIQKSNPVTFSIINGTVEKTIFVTPVGVEDWNYMLVIDKDYINLLIDRESKIANDMVKNLALAVCAVMVMIMIIAAVNKYKYNEENKDLSAKADTDLLTGVNNKIATERKIKEYIEENPDTQCLMMLFDVDNFKKINDTMGHAFGDEVLKTLGHGLSKEFRATDIIGRIGGDEFVLFLKNLKTDELVEKEGTRVVDFFKDFKAGDYVKYSATASIGGSVFPRDGKSFEELYKACDNALYEAKRQGKNRIVYYNKKMEGNVELRDQLAKENPGARL